MAWLGMAALFMQTFPFVLPPRTEAARQPMVPFRAARSR
jgi:hypothetical protein